MFKNKDKDGNFTSFLSESVELEGKLVTSGEMRIECQIRGTVFANNISVGEKAQVEGELIAKNMSVDGMINGTVNISSKLDILSSGKVSGVVKTSYLRVDEGALLDSEVEILSPPNNLLTKTPELKKPSSPVVHREDDNQSD